MAVHTLIVGNNDSDMTEITDRLLMECAQGIPVYGYRTEKLEADESGAEPVYIYPAVGERIKSEENLVGWCRNKKSDGKSEMFEKFAYLISEAPDDGIILMDELGSMECKSEKFCASVMARLDGDVPVLAAVRDREKPFLEAVRKHSNARCFVLPGNDRETVYREAEDFFKKQLLCRFSANSSEE